LTKCRARRFSRHVRGHLVVAAFVMNGRRSASMQRTIAQLGGAAYEFCAGRPLPPPEKPKAASRRTRGRRAGGAPKRARPHQYGRDVI